MDTNQAARQQAQAEHQHGVGQANTSNWDYNARQAYESERAYLKKLDEERKNG